MTQTKLDRLRARGTVHIEADADGYRVSWWPKGQAGNPFCGRGDSGPVLDPLVDALEEKTRPTWRDWESAKYAREWQAEQDAAERQRFWMRSYDMDDRRRERKAREWQEYLIEKAKRDGKRERERVRKVLAG